MPMPDLREPWMTKPTVRLRPVVSRVAVAALLAVGSLTVGAVPAGAHVTVDAGDARQGEQDAVLTFRVPNERSDATTVAVIIKFPTRTPFGSVKPAPKAGWTVTTKRVTLNPPITTADGEITQGVAEVSFRVQSPANGIPDGSFEAFQMLVGRLPTGAGTFAFPTVQTYSNGQVSSWIEPTVAGSEPSHPAPVLTLGSAQASEQGPGTEETGEPGASPPSPDTISDEVRTARLIGLIGVVTGSLGMLGAGIAIGRSRRESDPSRT
jgi:uncharacterized protein YcnI